MITANSPLQTTFRVLGNPHNRASIAVLAHGMKATDPAIRIASIQSLLSRGGPEEMAAIVAGIDHCTKEDLPLLRNYANLFVVPIEASLESQSPETRQQAIVSIGKLQVAAHYHNLVKVVTSVDDPQQIVAAQILEDLVVEIGSQARSSVTLKPIAGRSELLDVLEQAVLSYPEHRMKEVIDAWLLASHWDDEGFQRLFASLPEPHEAQVLKRLRASHRSEILQLLLGTMWSRSPIAGAIELALEKLRDDFPPEMCILERRFGITSQLVKNLRQYPMGCLTKLNFSSLDGERCPLDSVLRLLVASAPTPDVILSSVVYALANSTVAIEKECALAIRSIRLTNSSVITMVLSDCFEMPDIDPYEPPRWKAELRAALDSILAKYYELPASVRSALDWLLQEFRCDQLFEHLEDWPDAHVRAYARVTKLVDPDCIDLIRMEANCGSPARRARALRLIRFLGKDEHFDQIAIEALNDVNDEVRIQAIQVIAMGMDKQQVFDLLTPLLNDEHHAVQAAASLSLSELEQE